MKNKCFARLRERRGESLVEGLISMLIIVLASLMLAGAIVSAARLNHTMKGTVTLALTQEDLPATGTDGNCACTLSEGFRGGDYPGEYSLSIPITTYEDKWGFSYYGKK